MKHPRVSDSEWPLLEILWSEGAPLGLGEIISLLSEGEQTPPNSKTIATFLTRLVQKGVVKTRKLGRNNLYEAAVERGDCVRGETQNFLQRVFQGATAPAVLHLLENQDLSDEEIAELEAILKRRKS